MRSSKSASWLRVLAVALAALGAGTITIVVSSCMTGSSSSSSAADEGEPEVYVPQDFRRFSAYEESEYMRAFRDQPREDVVAELYADPLYKEVVLRFFTSITRSREIAQAILDGAGEYEVPATLAFALAYEESRFDPRAYHRNSASIDRGLFQLNSASFPNMSVDDFYDPRKNARYGISHLAYCLAEGGNDVAALAIYNAGFGRVSKGGTPRKTLDYIARITGYAANLDALFEAQVVARRVAALKVQDFKETHAD